MKKDFVEQLWNFENSVNISFFPIVYVRKVLSPDPEANFLPWKDITFDKNAGTSHISSFSKERKLLD